MKRALAIAILYVAVTAPVAYSGPALLDIIDVSAPAINCIFDLDCTIVVSDTTDHFTLDGTVGDAFLQSRTFPPGEPGTVAEGLYGYEYRIDLRQLVGILNIPCITAFSIEFGPVVPLDYDGDGDVEDVYVITSGGLGSVAPTAADQVGNAITFEFEPPVCAGGSPGNGESTFFFGLTSSMPPRDVVAQVRDTTEMEYTLNARAPFSGELLDHFKCYDILGESVGESVLLRDQFGDEKARVLEAVRLCNPVEKTDDDIVTPIRNRAAHLKFYRIETETESPARQVAVTNQFGQEQKLEVLEPMFLAVPTQKLRHQPPKNLDHFKCYEASGESIDVNVTLKDQFHVEPGVKVRDPVVLCSPVEKTHDDIVTPIQNPDDHLVCYNIEGASIQGGAVTRNQFGVEILSVGRADLLCVPSRKIKVSTEPVPGEVTDDSVEAAAPSAVPPTFQGCRSPAPDFVVTGSETVVSGDEHCFPSDGTGGFGPRSDILRLTIVDGMDVADMDADGDNDFLVCDGTKGEVYLYTQDPPGTFTPSVVATGVTSGADGSLFCTYLREGDFDEDGQKDFVVGDNRVANGMFIYLQGPPGTFTQVPPGLDVSWASPSNAQCNCLFGVAVGDVDGDGHQDVLVLGYRGAGAGQVWFYQGDGAGGMAAPIMQFNVSTDFPVVSAPTGLALFDLNGDGDLDIIVGGSGDGSHYIYANDGLGNFTMPPGPVFDVHNYTGIDAYDFDGDNDDDLVLVDWTIRNLLYVQNLGGGILAAPVPVGNVDGNSIGIGAPQLTVQPSKGLDHFKCYPIEESEPVGVPVFLRDQFGAEEAQVQEPIRFCNPVEKRHANTVTPIKDRDAHLKFYRIETETQAPARQVVVSNQFGQEQKLEVLEPVFLAVPTQKLEPEPHQPPKDLDHFKCYEASGEPVSAELTLRDQFGPETGVEMHDPVLLCNPVEKTHNDIVTPIQNPDDHLVCYKLEGTQFTATAQVGNQFGEEILTVEPADLLCVPSRKTSLEEKEPRITHVGHIAVGAIDGGNVPINGPGAGLANIFGYQRPFGRWIPIHGDIPSGVHEFRVVYRLEGNPRPGDPADALGIPVVPADMWRASDWNPALLDCSNWTPYSSDADGWFDATEFRRLEQGEGMPADCNAQLALTMWNSDNPALPDTEGHYVIWLQWRTFALGPIHEEPFDHHVQFDNEPPENLALDIPGGACATYGPGDMPIMVQGHVDDAHFLRYRLRIFGGNPPNAHWYPSVNYDDPGPEAANVGPTGTGAGNVNLHEVDVNVLPPPPLVECAYGIRLSAEDRTIVGGFNPPFNLLPWSLGYANDKEITFDYTP